MNKAELIEAVADRADLKKAEAARAVEALFDGDGIVATVLKRKERLQLTGFGTFQVKERPARKGRNPRTGEEIDIAAANVPAFKPGQVLKDALNG